METITSDRTNLNMSGKNDVTQDLEHIEISDSEKLSSSQADEQTARYAYQAIHIDEATNKRLFWKINGRILVVMLVTYFCQSLDKGTLNFASIMGIREDAELKGQEVRGEKGLWDKI